MRVDTIARVRRAFHVQGWSMKKISRELHVSRNTVRKILRSDETDFAYECPCKAGRSTYDRHGNDVDESEPREIQSGWSALSERLDR